MILTFHVPPLARAQGLHVCDIDKVYRKKWFTSWEGEIIGPIIRVFQFD